MQFSFTVIGEETISYTCFRTEEETFH